jgi:hypothetical protein
MRVKSVSFDVIIIGITLLEDSLIFQINPQVLFNHIKIDVTFDVIQNELVFCAKQ